MRTYEIIVEFKSNKPLNIKLDSDKSLTKIIESTGKELEEAKQKRTPLWVSNYLIDSNEILYVKIEGDLTLEKHSRKKLQNTRKKIK